MNEKYFTIKEDYKEKWELIKEIIKHHPGYGTQEGYSWYIGGMKDTGEWKIEVMLEDDSRRLQFFLEKLRPFEENAKTRFEERQKIFLLPEKQQEEIFKKERDEQRQQMIKWQEDIERHLIWGK